MRPHFRTYACLRREGVRALAFLIFFSWVAAAQNGSVALTVTNMPPSARRIVAIADDGAGGAAVYTRQDLTQASGSVMLDLGLPAGTYRIRVLAEASNHSITRTGKTAVTVPASGAATASVALEDAGVALDPITPSAATAGSPAVIRFVITDHGEVLEGAAAYLYSAPLPFNLVTGGALAGSADLVRGASGTFTATFNITAPMSGAAMYYQLRVQVQTAAEPAVLYSPDPNVSPALPWQMDLIPGPAVDLNVTSIPPGADRLVVIADGGPLAAPVYSRWTLAPGSQSAAVSLGLPAGTLRIRAFVDGSNRSILRSGKAIVTVPVTGDVTAEIRLANLSVSVDPSTPSAAAAGSTATIRFQISDAGDVVEGARGSLFGGTSPFDVITGGSYHGAANATQISPGAYTLAFGVNVPTVTGAFHYVLRAQIAAGGEPGILYSPEPGTLLPPWQLTTSFAGGISVTVSGIPAAATRVVVIADGPAVTGPVYTRKSLPQGTSNTVMTIGLPAGTYRLRALCDGVNAGVMRTGQVTAAAPASGTGTASLALSDVMAVLDPSTPVAGSRGAAVTIKLSITDPGDVLESTSAYLYSATAAFNLITGGKFSGAQPLTQTASGQYTVSFRTNLPAAGTALYYAIRAQLPTGGTYSMLYSPDPNLPATAPWSIAAGLACTYTFNPSTISIQAAGGAGSFTVNTNSPVCPWNVQSTVPWLRVSPTPGPGGSGTIEYTAAANSADGADRTGTILVGSQAVSVTQSGVSLPGGLRFVTLPPCRVADTRNATGPFGGPFIVAGATRTFKVPQSACGVPADAQAYSLNVTVVPHGFLGYLSLWPTGLPQPYVSTLNSYDGRIKANAAILPAGTEGAISVFASDSTDVVLDINGYFVPKINASALAFFPVTPCRVFDSRWAPGPFGGPAFGSGATRDIEVPAGPCSVPSGATAYSVNVTATPKGELGYVTTWPAGSARPFVSTLNAPTGAVTANAAIVPAGVSGSISIFAANPTDIAVDVNGYFAPAAGGGLSFYTLTPCRVADTRNAAGSFGGPALSGQRSFPVPSGPCAVPAAAAAYSFNATVVPPGKLSFLAIWPGGIVRPNITTLSSYDATAVSNAVLVAGPSGVVNAYASEVTDLILDINGFFAP